MAVILKVQVSPRAKRPGILGWHGDALKVAVSAAPEDGEANRELIKCLSTAIGIPLRDIEIIRGHTSKSKVLELQISQQELDQAFGKPMTQPDLFDISSLGHHEER